MPDVKKVRILSRHGNSGTSEWDVDIDGCPLHWKERDHFDDVNRIFKFHSIEGDFDTLNGHWSVRDDEDGILVEFMMEYLIGIPVIEEILSPILNEHLKNNSMRMLNDLKEKIEAVPLTDQRTEPRKAVEITATILQNGQSEELRIRDLSESGAGIEYPRGISLDRVITLVIPNGSESRIILADVIWIGNGSRRAGVRFTAKKKELQQDTG